ncbi:MAG: tRNA epoxyqueuosine(34) reductase QueG [Elusimicrobia bacterium]|nr:tRNA epoxyqueuosine(34) reductase QueG [Elusimicrobiota bacterium]
MEKIQSSHRAVAAIKEMALALGFDRVAVTGPEPAVEDGERLAAWSEQGNGAGMAWLGRDPAGRASPVSFLAQAQSVITLAVSYGGGEFPPAPGVPYGRVARYAWGQDYHTVIQARLDLFKERLRREFGDVAARPSVDVEPFLERAFARRAGLGFVGKNTNLIVPGAGSFLFLATVVVGLGLPSDEPVRPGCGSCVRCAEHCPTGALDTPYSLDARLCLAYHTVENRGAIPIPLRERWGDWLLGCDTCQDVCPFNARPLESRWPEFSPDRGPGPWVSLADVLSFRNNESFHARFGKTALVRPKRAGLVRNACLAAAHIGAVDLLKKELLDCLCRDTDPVVRGHAAWSVGFARPPWGLTALHGALKAQTDSAVQAEIQTAILLAERT